MASAWLGSLWLGDFFGDLGHGRELCRVGCAVFRHRKYLAHFRRAAKVVQPGDEARKSRNTTADRCNRETSDGVIQFQCQQRSSYSPEK